MKAEILNPFLASFMGALRGLARTEARPGRPRVKTDAVAKGDISCIIGFVGDSLHGSFAVTMDANLARAVYTRMLGGSAEGNDQAVVYVTMEIASIMAEDARMALARQGHRVRMSAPMVVTGIGHTVRHSTQGPNIAMPFWTEIGDAWVELCATDLGVRP